MVHFKNRYLILEAIVDPNLEAGDTQPMVLSSFNVTKAIKGSIHLNFGECGLASSFSALHVKYVNPLTKVCIVRASRDDHKKIWTAISMVRSIGRCPVFFNLLDLSGKVLSHIVVPGAYQYNTGCIRACRRKALACEETKFEHYRLMYGGRVTPQIDSSVKSNFERINALEN